MTTYKFLSLFPVLAFLILGEANAQPISKNDSLILKAKQKLYQVEHAPNSTSIEQAKNKLEKLLNTTDKKWLVRYYIAHANKMLTDRAIGSKKDDAEDNAEAYLDQAIELLKESIKEKGNFSDAHTLLGYVYYKKIKFSLLKSLILSKYGSDSFDKALEIDKENPRIYLLMGAAKYYTPFLLGGGKSAALDKFKKAEKKFQAAPNQVTILPTWGFDKVYEWMGTIASQRGHTKKARTYYNKALEINPYNYWVKDDLLPRLNKRPW